MECSYRPGFALVLALAAAAAVPACGSFGEAATPILSEAGALDDAAAAADGGADGGATGPDGEAGADNEGGTCRPPFGDDFERLSGVKGPWDLLTEGGGGKLSLNRASLFDDVGDLRVALAVSGGGRAAFLERTLPASTCKVSVSLALGVPASLPVSSVVSVRFSSSKIDLRTDGVGGLELAEVGAGGSALPHQVMPALPIGVRLDVRLVVDPAGKTASVEVDRAKVNAFAGTFNLTGSHGVASAVRVGAVDAAMGGDTEYHLDTVRIQ